MDSKKQADLQVLKETYLRSPWVVESLPEPCIGDIDCPTLAGKYAERGRSCFAVFVYRQNGRYCCLHERCYQEGVGQGPAFHSMKEAIRHQKRYHFSYP
jgi:hypothetical protein